MNKLIPFSTFAKSSLLSNTSVVVGETGTPIGFVFGRDAFISLLTTIDGEFEKKVKNPKQAASNPAGKLIDLIEENLPIDPAFIKKITTARAQETAWIPFDKVVKALHV